MFNQYTVIITGKLDQLGLTALLSNVWETTLSLISFWNKPVVKVTMLDLYKNCMRKCAWFPSNLSPNTNLLAVVSGMGLSADKPLRA